MEGRKAAFKRQKEKRSSCEGYRLKRQRKIYPNVVEQKIEKYHSSIYGSTLWNENVCEGPVYVCTYCLHTWVRCSVHTVGKKNNVTMVDECNMLAKCRVGITSKGNKEWIWKNISKCYMWCKRT